MSISYDCGGLLSSFDQCGKDKDLIIAGGSVVMCIVRFDDGQVRKLHSFRIKQKLDQQVAQLAWNHVLQDDVIGMASPSGKLFELKITQDGGVIRRQLVDPEHQQTFQGSMTKRQISRVRFHPTEPMLFSSSHDGQIRGFDLREACGLATRLPQVKPSENNTALPKCYDFQFEKMSAGNHIYAIYDTGLVNVWDWRQQKSPIFSHHLGTVLPLFSLDLHPTIKRYVAVSSRDTTSSIVLHSFDKNENRLVMRVPNVAGRLEWRPNREDQFATCSVTPDQLVYVWDVRRPYVPFATFDGHHKVVDLQWRKNDEHTLIVADNYEPTADEKHGYLIWHRFSTYGDSSLPSSACPLIARPSETFRSSALSLSCEGEIISVRSNNRDHLKNPAWSIVSPQTPHITTTTNVFPKSSRFSMSRAFSHIPPQFSTESSGGNLSSNASSRPIEIFLSPTSVIESHIANEVAAEVNAIKAMAKDYRLHGSPVAQLCVHNAAVATKCNRLDIARAWELIGATLGSICPQQISVLGSRASLDMSDRSQSPDPSSALTGARQSFGSKLDQQPTTDSTLQTGYPNRIGRSLSQTAGDQESAGFYGGTTTDSEDNDHDMVDHLIFGSNVDDHDMAEDDSNMIIPVEMGPSAAYLKSLKKPEEWLHTSMASTVDNRRRSYDSKVSTVDKPQSSNLTVPSNPKQKNQVQAPVKLEDYFLSIPANTETNIFSIRAFEWSSVIVDMIESFANINDAQSAVSMLIVVGSSLSPGSLQSFAPDTLRVWFQEYIALLSRLRLPCSLGKLLNVAYQHCTSLHAISSTAHELGLVDTTFTPLCHGCGDRALALTSGNSGPFCKKCKKVPAICSVCNRPVKGLYAWCRVCLHGGHLFHFNEWFQKKSNKAGEKVRCPTGSCGHECDLSLPR